MIVPSQVAAMVVDANVVIDFQKSDPEILTLASLHIASLKLPLPVMEEISDWDENDCAEYKVEVVECSFEQIEEAVNKKGAMTFHDWCCFILARDNEWACVTNDKPLRNHCQRNKVRTIWGLELLTKLVEIKKLTKKDALHVWKTLQKNSPTYYTAELGKKLQDALDAL